MSDIPKLVQLLIGELEGSGVNATRVVVDDPNPPPQMLGMDNDISAAAFSTQLAGKITQPIEARLADVGRQIDNLNSETVRQLGYMVDALQQMQDSQEPEPRHILSSSGGGGGGGSNAAHARAETFRTSFNVEDSPSRLAARNKKGLVDTLKTLGLGVAGMAVSGGIRGFDKNDDKKADKKKPTAKPTPQPSSNTTSNTLVGGAVANTPLPPEYFDVPVAAVHAKPNLLNDLKKNPQASNYMTYAALANDLENTAYSQDNSGISEEQQEAFFRARQSTSKIDKQLEGDKNTANFPKLAIAALKASEKKGYDNELNKVTKQLGDDRVVEIVKELHASGLLERVKNDEEYDLKKRDGVSQNLIDKLGAIDESLTTGQWKIKGGVTRAQLAGIKSEGPEQDILGAMASYAPTKTTVANQEERVKIDKEMAEELGQEEHQKLLAKPLYQHKRHEIAEKMRKSKPSTVQPPPQAINDDIVTTRIGNLAAEGVEQEVLNDPGKEGTSARVGRILRPGTYEEEIAAAKKKYKLSSEASDHKTLRKTDWNKDFSGLKDGNEHYLEGHKQWLKAENKEDKDTPLIDPKTGKPISYDDAYKKYDDPKYYPFMDSRKLKKAKDSKFPKDEALAVETDEETILAFQENVEDLKKNNEPLYQELLKAAKKQKLIDGADFTLPKNAENSATVANAMMGYADKHGINQLHVYENLLQHANKNSQGATAPVEVTDVESVTKSLLEDNKKKSFDPPEPSEQVKNTGGEPKPPVEQLDTVPLIPPDAELKEMPPPPLAPGVPKSEQVMIREATKENNEALHEAIANLGQRLEGIGGSSHTTVNHNNVYAHHKSIPELRAGDLYRNLGMPTIST